MTLLNTLCCAIVLAALSVGCLDQSDRTPVQGAGNYKSLALQFVTSLAKRDYAAAYRVTSKEYQTRTSLDQMRAGFEAIVPEDWKIVGPIEVGNTMENWPEKRPLDVGWAYVSVGGDVYSEAVTVIVTSEAQALRVRSVEFGRP
ncbi:MAG: hypothetical protein H7X76_01930 [Prolixibacteraceae bacterium]|nr:hypothetical protein [Burkholderiales bacterium]